jgi:hypothetical protein
MTIRPNHAQISYGDHGTTITPFNNKQTSAEAEFILKRIDGRARMRKAALEGHNSSEPNHVLRELRQDMYERGQRTAQETAKALAGHARELGNLAVEPLDPALIEAEAETSATTAATRPLQDLVPSEAVHQVQRRKLNNFRAERQLDRDATHPDVPLATIMLITAMLVEAAGAIVLFNDASNGAAEAMTFGFLAAFITAVLGLALGGLIRPLRWEPHPTTLLGKVGRALQAGGALTISLILLAANLGFGHFRDNVAAAGQGIGPGLEALVLSPDFTIIFRPLHWFAFQTTQGFLMTFMGLVLAGFAAWKGYTGFSDKVPGYSTADRAYRTAANVALAHQDALRDSVATTLDHADAILAARLARDADSVARARELLSQATFIADQYGATRDNLVNIGNTVVRALMEAYQEVRPDLPDYLGPGAFFGPDDFPSPLASLSRFQQGTQALEAGHAANRAHVPALKRNLLALRRRLCSEVERAIARVAGHDHDAAARQARMPLDGRAS